jgi:hypothetical protein
MMKLPVTNLMGNGETKTVLIILEGLVNTDPPFRKPRGAEYIVHAKEGFEIINFKCHPHEALDNILHINRGVDRPVHHARYSSRSSVAF